MSGPSYQPRPPVDQPAQPTPPTPKKPHTGRNIGLGCGGGILAFAILIIIIAAATSANSGNTTASRSTPTHQATTKTQPKPSPTPKPATPTPKPATPPPTPKPATPKPQPVVLTTASGSSSGESPAFHPTSQYKITYSFDCSSLGQAGNFIIGVDDDNGSPTFGEATVNRLAIGGQGTANGYNMGDYTVHVQVITECDWNITVMSNPS